MAIPARPARLKKLGKHSTGVGCVYVRKLADVDLAVLRELLTRSYRDMKERYG